MKKKRDLHILVFVELFLLSLLLVFIFSTKHFSLTLTGFTIYESASDGSTINDTYLREISPDNNYALATTLRIGNISTGGGTEYRILIKDFNISSINSGNTIMSAKLQLYVNQSFGNSNLTIKAYRVTSDWIESQATWNNRTSSNTWSTVGGDYTQELDSLNITNQSGTYYNLTITKAVRGWVNGSYNNYGIILLSINTQSGNYTYLASSEESNSAQRPKFIIDYSANAVPTINGISTDSSLSSLKQIGEHVNITVNWTDLESDSGQLFICNSSSINKSGCSDATLCNTSFESFGPSSCLYTVLSTDNRTQNFWLVVCDSNNCSNVNQSQFYMNHAPVILITDPNGGETLNQSLGNYTLKFNVSDSDSDSLTADIYYGSSQNSTTNTITSNLNLNTQCTDSDSDNSTANNCSYSWNSSGIYGTFFLTIIINDSTITSNDSSDSFFDIRSLIDNIPPNITAQWIESDISSGEQIQIYANASDPNIDTVWVSINTTPQTNLTMTNTSTISPIIYNTTWTAISLGVYQFKVWANDTINNINNSMSWQVFNISKPNASSQNETAPSTALPYHAIKITSQLNATDILRGIYAYLNTPKGFTFLSNYSQNLSLGNFTYNQTKTAVWFLSVPITEKTYILNITFSDYYSNSWNSSNMQIQVTSAIGGYEISIAGYPEVETSGAYFTQAYFKQNGLYTNPDSIFITIIDAGGSTIVGPASMTQESTGIYNYSYTVGASATEGQWETIINSTKNSISYYAHKFWKVVGGPFDVRSINIIDSTTPSLNISVVTENTGGANKDLTLTWNLTRTDTNEILDSGSDTFMVLANSEKTWYIQPSITYTGNVKITFLGYYSETEKAGAYETFTSSSGNISCGDGTCNGGESCSTCPQDCGACPSGGGGGGGGEAITAPTEKKIDLKIETDEIIYITKNIEKTIFLKITNTGASPLTNLILKLENLPKELYSIFPEKITSLKPGESKQFEIKFLIKNFIGEYNFNYLIKTDETSKKHSGKIITLTMTDYFIREIERLKNKVEELKNKTNNKDLLEDLSKCEELILQLKSNIKKEEFINAKNNLIKAEDCINNIKPKIKKPVEIKMNYIVWIITWILLIVLIAVLIFIVYVIYKKINIFNFLNKKEQTKELSKSSETKKSYIEEKIKNIEEKIK